MKIFRTDVLKNRTVSASKYNIIKKEFLKNC